MTDDHANTSATDAEGRSDADARNADEDFPSSDTMSAPGGGPRRVVSSNGVDDILESLNSGPAESAGGTDGVETKAGTEDGAATVTDPTDSDATETAVAAESEPTSESEREPASTSASSANAGANSTSTSSESANPNPNANANASASEALSAIRNGHENGDRGRPLEGEGADSSAVDTISDSSTTLSLEESDADGFEATSADAAGGDDAASDSDGFAARLDNNAVTGADVRAAEAGDGRERTPEVDEIDLSMDDLERTRAATEDSSSSSSSGSGSTSGSGGGPLAGTTDPNTAGAATEDVDDGGNAEVDGFDADDATTDSDPDSDLDTDADSSGSGLLGRVRSLFSR